MFQLYPSESQLTSQIKHRRKDLVDSQGGGFLADDFRHSSDQLSIPRRPISNRRVEDGCIYYAQAVNSFRLDQGRDTQRRVLEEIILSVANVVGQLLPGNRVTNYKPQNVISFTETAILSNRIEYRKSLRLWFSCSPLDLSS